MNIGIILLTVFLTGLLLAGDWLIKYATVSSSYFKYLIIAAIVWVISIPGWYYVVRDNREAIIGALFAVFSIMGTTLIGVYGFNEKLSTTEWTGIGFAIISAILLTNKI